MKIIKFVLGLILVVLVLAVLLVLALPKMLSTDKARTALLTKVNEQAPGTLSIEGWTLGWLDGPTIEGLAFDDEMGRPVVRVDQVSVSKSLLQLAKNYQDLGDILVRNPHLYVYPPEPPSEGEEDGGPAVSKTKPAADGKKKSPSSGGAPFPVPDLRVHLLVDGGGVSTATGPDDAVAVAREIQVDLNVEGLGSPIAYNLSLAAGTGEGTIVCKGDLELGDVSNLDPNKVRNEMSLAIVNWQLKETLELLSSVGGVPTGSGTVAAQVQISGSPAAGIDVNGDLLVSDLRLAGGPFKEDHPSIPSLELKTEARFAEKALSLSTLKLVSGLATMEGSGTVSADADGQVNLAGSVDLAEISRQFKTTLGLKDSLVIDDAVLRIRAELGSRDGTYLADAGLAIDRISGSSDGAPLDWDQPTTLNAVGAWGATEKKLEKLELRSPFMTVQGSGDLDLLQITIAADTGAALAEAKKFIDLEQWNASGALDAVVKLETTFAGAEGNALGKPVSAVLGATVRGASFSVQKGDQQLVPARPVDVQLDAEVRLDEDQALTEIVGPRLSFSAWVGKGLIRMDRVSVPASGEMPGVQGLTGEGTLDLGLVHALLRELEAVPEDLGFGGAAAWSMIGSVDAGVVQLKDVGLKLTAFELRQGEKTMPAQDISLQLAGQVTPERRSAELDRIQLVLGSGPVTVSGIQIADWSKPLESVQASMDLSQDLARLIPALGGFAALPEGRTIAGQFDGKGSLSSAADSGQAVELTGTLSGLRVSDGGKSLLDEKEPIELLAKVSRKGDALAIQQLKLESKPIQLDMTGDYQAEADLNQAKAKGELGIDLDVVTTYLTSLLDMDISMTGKENRPFSFASSWRKDETNGLMKNAKMDLDFRADTISAFGVYVVDLDVPLAMSEGVARMDLTGQVNEGLLTVHPTIDFNQGDGLVAFPESTNLFTGVQLTEEIGNELLAKFHPLFKGATGVTGSMDMHMAAFHWPLGASEANARAFNGTLHFADLKMATSGLWGRIMELMKAKERQIDIGDKDLDFECREQRVYCSPLTIDVDHHEVSIEGSIGFDQTLDYVAKVPVTESLARSLGVGPTDYTNYLAGTTVNVPIRGTASKPDISSRVLTDAVTDLAKQAAKKAVADKVKGAIGEEAGKVLEGLFGR